LPTVYLLQGFTHPVREHFLENILETTGYTLTSFNQLDDYGQDKIWKTQKQAVRKKKSQLATLVEVQSLEVQVLNYFIFQRYEQFKYAWSN
jgi:ATP-dependent RNA helicase DHX36